MIGAREARRLLHCHKPLRRRRFRRSGVAPIPAFLRSGAPASGPQPPLRDTRVPRYGFSARSPSRTFPCATLVPGGTLCVSHTLPPITDPRPIVTRPRIVAPA